MPSTSFSAREELANSLSHGLGLLGAIVATPVLIVGATRGGDAGDIVGRSVFGATLVVLYLASTCYHASPAGRLKEWLRRVDHAAIYLLIAGTYTPFTLGVLRGAWGWSLFGIVWGAAAVGVCTKMISGVRYPRVSTAIYLLMGWLIVVAAAPLLHTMPTRGIQWLVLGGALYTLGVPLFAAGRIRYNHLAWHVFVLAGSTCHFVAVMWYAA
jgi:hemolysin III